MNLLLLANKSLERNECLKVRSFKQRVPNNIMIFITFKLMDRIHFSFFPF